MSEPGVTALISALGQRAGIEGDAELARAAGEALKRGRTAWPALEASVGAEQFADFLAGRVLRQLGVDADDGAAPRPAAAEVAALLDRLHVGDLFLVCGCLSGAKPAVQALEQAIVSRVPLYVHRMRLSASVLDELRQRLREHLLVGRGDRGPALAEYHGTGPLDGWARITTQRLALRLRGSDPAALESVRPSDELELLAPVGDPELDYLRTRYREQVGQALREAMRKLQPRERTLLRLSYVSGKSIDDIGRVYRVHRATAARWIGLARERLLELTREGLMTELGLGETDCRSLMGLLRSQLDITMERLIGPRGGKPS